MGEVYLAQHETLGRQCALKVIPPDEVTEIGWQRFQLEAKSVAKLEHVNLVRVTDLGIHDGCLPFYAMDYVEGKNLAELVAESGALPLDVVLDIFAQVCDGVDCAHRSGILHRDLKPANIMVVPTKSGNKLAKVLDFGLAKLTAHDRTKQSLTAVGDIFGSPFYMSPEQCIGDKLDRRSDIYSLGCTLFECLTGQPPFPGDQERTIRRCHLHAQPPTLESIVGQGKFPPAAEIVMAKLLRKNPVERYQSLQELRGDLERMVRGEEVEPVYVSRGKPWPDKATAPPSSTSGTALENARHRAPFGLRLLIFSLVLIAVAGTIAVVCYVKLRPSVFKRDAPVSTNESKPFSKVVVENGKIMRAFDFPNGEAIGTIRSGSLFVEARHHVKVPANDLIEFTPYPVEVNDPNYLKRFRSGEIAILSMLVTSDLANQIREPKSSNFLNAISLVPGVQGLSINTIGGCSLTEKDLPTLEKMNSLKTLWVKPKGIDAIALSKLATLNHFETLNLELGDDVTPVLKALNSSSQLKRLYLTGSQISLDGFSNLAKLPKLEFLSLDLNGPGTPDFAVKAINLLSSAPELKQLEFNEIPISAEAIIALRPFRKLEDVKWYPPKWKVAALQRQKIAKETAGFRGKTRIRVFSY